MVARRQDEGSLEKLENERLRWEVEELRKDLEGVKCMLELSGSTRDGGED